MTNFRSLTPGGYFASADDKSLPVSIRFNNAGAINGASWETTYPGYAGTVETTPGNKSTIFETPEQGVAAWWELMRRYAVDGATTVSKIITKYGGGQDYSAYLAFVTKEAALGTDQRVDLTGSDRTLLAFAKAMFHYEAGRATPLSDAQILAGFALGRAHADTGAGVTIKVTPAGAGPGGPVPTVPAHLHPIWDEFLAMVHEWLAKKPAPGTAAPSTPSTSSTPGALPAAVSTLVSIASDTNKLQSAQHVAAAKLLKFDGEVYPSDGCAITLSTLLQDAGIDVPDTYQALALGNLLKTKHWQVIPVGQQLAGDVGSTCGPTPNHGSDHIYLVLRILNSDEMVVVDNQATAPHFRWASGKGGKTPTKFFLRQAA